jgi:hypothetical protein
MAKARVKAEKIPREAFRTDERQTGMSQIPKDGLNVGSRRLRSALAQTFMRRMKPSVKPETGYYRELTLEVNSFTRNRKGEPDDACKANRMTLQEAGVEGCPV